MSLTVINPPEEARSEVPTPYPPKGAAKREIGDDNVLAWIRRLAQIRAQKKFWEDAEKDAVAQLRGALGISDTTPTTSFTRGGVPIAFDRVTERRTVDTKELREIYPDVAEAVTKVSTSRAFYVLEGVEVPA